jgi:hypothetical protein
MPADTPTSVLIVDRSRAAGYRLRECLLKSDTMAHVFDGFVPALAMLRRKKIDTVVVEFDADKATIDFCNAVKDLHVPIVYSSAPVQPLDPRQFGFEVTFPTLPHSPSMRVQYAHARNSELTIACLICAEASI